MRNGKRKRELEELNDLRERRKIGKIYLEGANHGGSGSGELKLPVEMLELILRNLKTDDLKNCRLVSKTWNLEASRLLQGKLVTRLKSWSMNVTDRLHKLKGRARLPSVPTLLQEIELEIFDDVSAVRKALSVCLPQLPCITRLFIHGVYTGRHSFDAGRDCAWVISNCSSTLTHLVISGEINLMVDALGGCKMPELQLLDVELLTSFLSTEPVKHQYALLDKVNNIVGSSPKLHTLRTKGDKVVVSNEIIRGKTLNFQHIRHLEITEGSVIYWELLQQKHLPALKSLAVKGDDTADETNLCKFVHRFAPTLEDLDITCNMFSPREWGHDCPHFPVLQVLSVSRFEVTRERWIEKTPALKHLRIETLDLCHLAKADEQTLKVVPSIVELTTWKIMLPESSEESSKTMLLSWRIFPSLRCWTLGQRVRRGPTSIFSEGIK